MTSTTSMCARAYLWTCSPILDLAGVQALLVGVFHAGKDSRAAESHWVDGTLIVEQHPVCDDLEIRQKVGFSSLCVTDSIFIYWTAAWWTVGFVTAWRECTCPSIWVTTVIIKLVSDATHWPLPDCRPSNLLVRWGRRDDQMSPEVWAAPASETRQPTFSSWTSSLELNNHKKIK